MEIGGGKESVSRKDVENDGERTIFAWDVRTLSPRKKQSTRELAEEEKQEGIQCQESPAREYLEQVKCSHDTDCKPMMKNGFTALKHGTWEEY